MVGIYKITNKINNLAYIGMSKNIEERIHEHKLRAFRNTPSNKEYNKTLYQAFRKYGLENFIFEILEECNENELEQKEIEYILQFDSYTKGYNETTGGDGIKNNQYQNHSKTNLTNKDVYNIREYYNNHCKQDEIYKKYQHLIGISGFKKIWNGYTWKEIHIDVYTPENKAYYMFQRNSHSENNSHAKLSIEDVKNIRLRKKNGEKCLEVWKDYQQLTQGGFRSVWDGTNWKQVIV